MGIENAGVLDAFAWDSRRGTLVLVMYETRPWSGDESQLLQLQNKLNAYASFILDGEMTGAFPQYRDAPVEIHLRTRHQPDALAASLLAAAVEQLGLQKIRFEVFQTGDDSCGCH